MGLADKTKYGVILKEVGGQPLTLERTWLSKKTALQHIFNSLDSGVFSWGTLLTMTINGELIESEEFYQCNY